MFTKFQLPVSALIATPSRLIPVPVTSGSMLVGAEVELDRPTNALLPVANVLVPKRIVKKKPPRPAVFPRHTCRTLCRCDATVPAVVPLLKVARRIDERWLVDVGVGFAAVPVLVKVEPNPPTNVVSVVPPAYA